MIRIAPQALLAIETAARNAFPLEACGLLIGRGQFIRRADESLNLAAASNRFEIDARLHLRLQRELRGTGDAIIGVFHSHPGGRAEPSAIDRAEAVCPGWIWLITAIDAEGHCETRAFVDRDGDFSAAELQCAEQ